MQYNTKDGRDASAGAVADEAGACDPAHARHLSSLSDSVGGSRIMRLTDSQGSRNTWLSESQSSRIMRITDEVVTAARDSRKGAKAKVSPSLAQLKMQNMSLHGREDDMKLLKAKLRDVRTKERQHDDAGINATSRPELVLLSGVSGTGKSALVMRGLCEPAKKMGLAFAGGKFDLNKKTSLPLSAFADAMSSLTTFIMARDDVQEIKKGVRDAIRNRDDAMLLLSTMPGCGNLFSSELTERPSFIAEMRGKNDRRDSIGGKEAVLRLQYAIRRLVKAICSHLNGVVLFIDDLQWSDAATIDLIKSIALDDEIPSLLLVGAYRTDEVSDSHPLTLHLRDNVKIGIGTTTIEVGNLSADHVRSLVAEALRMEGDEEAVSTLAANIHKKTEGNAFFVLMFLRSLYDEELLQYNFGTMRWRWDDKAVNSKLVTENVATILVNKLKRFGELSQMVLKVASCLGASFSMPATAIVVEALSSDSIDTETSLGDNESDVQSAVSHRVYSLIDELEREGLCQRDAGSVAQCQFSHDQIQSAAFELVPLENRDSFLGKIGGILLNRLNSEDLEENLFQVVSLKNCAVASASLEERTELARLNLRAGIKASENAAFDTAAVFCITGRDLLGTEGWNTDPNTMLQLCSEGANACFVNGDVSSMDALVNEVLGMEELPVEDKFKVYEVKILALTAAASFSEAIDTAIEVRSQLGLPTPPNRPASTLTVIKEFVKTNRMVGSRSAEEIASLPELKDERIIMGQRMLELMFAPSYLAQPTMSPLIGLLMVRTSVKHGLNASSCDAFNALGSLLCAVGGKVQRGREMAEAVGLILGKPGMRRMQSRVAFIPETFIYHWTSPLQGTLAPLLRGYQSGLEVGDVDSAAICVSTRCANLWFVGRPLDSVLHELNIGINVVTQLKQLNQTHNIFPFLLTVKKLRGVSCAEDEFQSFEDLMRVASETSNSMLRGYIFLLQLQLFVIFQEWDTALTLLAEAGDLRKDLFALFGSVAFTWVEGLTFLKAAQSSSSWLRKNKLQRKAAKSMKMIRGWLQKGNVNVVHTMHLLAAEHAALKGNDTEAEKQFKLAVAVATKNGFVQDKGLAHELASAHYASKGDDYWADYHLDCAARSYSDWGATTKLEQLAQRKQELALDGKGLTKNKMWHWCGDKASGESRLHK